MNVRLEEPADRPAALEVERAVFGSDEEPAIVETIGDEEGSFAPVAEEGDEIVGHVQFSRARVGDSAVTALGPVGVRPDRQGRGIGSGLIRAGLEEADRRGEVAAILIGDPTRLGFAPGSAFGLRNPFAGMGEVGSRSGRSTSCSRRSPRRPASRAAPCDGIRRSGNPTVEARGVGA